MRSASIVSLLLALSPLSACHLAFPFDAPALGDASVETGAPPDARQDAPSGDGPAADQGGLDLPPPTPDLPLADAVIKDLTPMDAAPPVDAPLPVDAPPPVDATPPADAPSPDGGVTIPGTWTTLPAGMFKMGSPTSEPCRSTLSASPQETLHTVTLNHGLLIQTTEVTQAQFTYVMGYDPSLYASCGADCPADRVTWHEAAAYCNGLSDLAGLVSCYKDTGSGAACNATTPCNSATAVCIKGTCRNYTPDPIYAASKIHSCPGYRLPTEAEWEYAYRATTKTAYYSGGLVGACTGCLFEASADQIGWYCKNGYGSTHKVGQKAPNLWGLYDMAGNVLEWCNDCYLKDLGSLSQTDPDPACPPSLRVLRGGAHNTLARKLRAAERYAAAPHAVDEAYGFRCLRTK